MNMKSETSSTHIHVTVKLQILQKTDGWMVLGSITLSMIIVVFPSLVGVIVG